MWTAWANILPPAFWAGNQTGEIVVWIVILSILKFLINAQRNNTAELKLCQPEEIITIQVRGERVLSENRLKRKRQRKRKKQEVKGVKRVEKNAQES